MKPCLQKIVLFFTLLAVACSSGDDAPSTDGDLRSRQQALGVSGGDIPLPAKMVSGKLQTSWNGTYAELLAADALAMCWTTQLERAPVGGTSDADYFISRVASKMSAAVCKTTCSNASLTTPPDVFYCAWMDCRKDPAFNIDAATGLGKALDTSTLRASSATTAYKLPTASALGLTGTQSTAVRNKAQEELAYADLSLCMAQHLRQHLDTVQVAFASGGELARLQEMVRERSLSATQQYSLLSKAFATTLAAPTAINNANYWIAPLTIWSRGTANPIGDWQRIGDDFATAISMLAEATEAAVELKLRDPRGQQVFGEFDPEAQRGNQWLVGPRVDVLNRILYDDPYYDRRTILTDMSAPEVGVLLGLARRADAVRLSFNAGKFDRLANKWWVALAVENFVRNEDCQRLEISPCELAALSTPQSAYVIHARHGITFEHSAAIVEALATALFGQPTLATKDTNLWEFDSPKLFAGGRLNQGWLAQNSMLHVIGNHQFTGDRNASATTGSLLIDPEFQIAPLSAHDFQSDIVTTTRLPPRDVNPSGDALPQGFFFKQSFDAILEPTRMVASTSVLAVAREALLQLATLQPTSRPREIFNRAQSAVDVIADMIGPRQVLMRRLLASTANSTACTGCVTLTPSSRPQTPSGTLHDLVIDVLTKSDDPFKDIAVMAGVPHAGTVVHDPTAVSIWGTSQSTLATGQYSTMSVTPLQFSYELRRRTGVSDDTNWNHGASVILRSGTTGSFAYNHVFTGALFDNAVVAFGGRFGQLAERAWRFEVQDWSSPKFDGFGLPRSWAPSADASLHGGGQGVATHLYLLERAATAANEATVALQQAFDTLQQETADVTALEAAETRAEELSTIEFKALCGDKDNCTPEYLDVPLDAGTCPANSPDLAYCEFSRGLLEAIIGTRPDGSAATVPLATEVFAQFSNGATTPTFEAYSGGQLQGLFIDQYNAVLDLFLSAGTFLAAVDAATTQVLAVRAEQAAAEAEHAQVEADISAAYAQIIAQNSQFAAQRDQYEANKDEYDTQVEAARRTKRLECKPEAFEDAEIAGYSISGDADLRVSTDADAHHWHYQSNDEVDGKSWSPAALIAQVEKCNQAKIAYDQAVASADAQKKAMDGLIAALQFAVTAANLQWEALDERRAASEARVEAAEARTAAAEAQRAAQVLASLQAAQAGWGELLRSVAALDGAYNQAALAGDRLQLEKALTGYDVRSRFGLRKRFRSYDLWRARALSENARRLAVAARRAIEERYVIDLSELHAPEAFVDAPALWADDIYDSDLKPPVAVGLERSPTTASGVYPNKLVDYVNNLRLFLDGYTVNRPTAEVRSDSEVIQLAGPAAQLLESSFSADFAYIEPDSMGWRFFCPETETWIAHPNAASFSTQSTPTWTLSTACGGKPPTLAQLGFFLDPWGRLQRHTAEPPFNVRHNTRVGNIAVNLVGAGIRDCQKAPDPGACYAEPFIRFDLEHVGPALVTNHEQTWRSLDIPVAIVEGGKALASEEWLDPVSNGFNNSSVGNVVRMELKGRPIGGSYQITLQLTPDVRVERIERIQLLTQTEYWVRQR